MHTRTCAARITRQPRVPTYARRLPTLAGLGLPTLPPELGGAGPLVPAAAAADAGLRQALATSRRVGELLLKSEEQEAAAVQQHADSLVQRYRWAGGQQA